MNITSGMEDGIPHLGNGPESFVAVCGGITVVAVLAHTAVVNAFFGKNMQEHFLAQARRIHSLREGNLLS